MLKSRRLLTIAELIPAHCRVYDIGCDHGLLSVYLYVHNHNDVVATDINPYSVEKTRQFVQEQKCKIDVILTDGLQGLPIKKEDYVVIAGMGTGTILSILRQADVCLSDHFVIASNNDHEALRRGFHDLGYRIVDERVVYEHKKYYVVIAFEKGEEELSLEDYCFGPFIRKREKNYLLSMLENDRIIQKKIPLKKWKTKWNLWRMMRKLKRQIRKIR